MFNNFLDFSYSHFTHLTFRINKLHFNMLIIKNKIKLLPVIGNS